METELPYDIEHRLRRGDGTYRWFHVRALPVREAGGAIARWCCLQTDIEDRKRAEALLAGEKHFLEMVAAGRSMPALLDALCQLVERSVAGCYCSVVLVDESGARLEHGAAPSLPASFIDSIMGRPVTIHAGPCGMAARLKEQVIAPDLNTESRWAEYAWCPMALAHGIQACWSTPIPSPAGPSAGAFAIYYTEPRTPTVMDYSIIEQFKNIASIAIERTRNEEALRRSEALLTEAQHLSLTGSFSWRVLTDLVVYSEQTYRTYGFEPGAPVTLDMIAARIHPEDIPLLQEMIDKARGPGSDLDYEYRLRMPDGSVKHLHLVARATRDEGGRLEYIGAIQDVTQRRRSEEALSRLRSQLAHVSKVTTLGALTASIAHEVNQPLAGIVNNASTCLRMLAADPPNVEGARETARRTIRDGNRAADVISRLRALFSKEAAVTDWVDLNAATREVLALSLNEFQSGGVIVRTEFAGDLPALMGDRVQLQQVILNLLLNASDAMSDVEDRPRQLVVRTECEAPDRVRLSVEDVGVGLGDDVERPFEAFYTTKASGMGIGLALSRSIIESHHGRLWAAANDGPGATFSFSIPQAPERVTGTHSLGSIRRSAGAGELLGSA